MAHTRRDANILGALALLVSGRILEGPQAQQLGTSGAAAVVALSGWLADSTIEQLSEVLGLSHSGCVRLVDRLEADGLLKRREGADRRSLSLRLTARGRRLAARLLDERAQTLEAVLAPLKRAERAQLAELHAALLGALTHNRAAARRTCRLCDAEGCGHYTGRCPVTKAADVAEAG